MTYRTDGGVKCADCKRGFSPDDLTLDVSGDWLCLPCARQRGSDEASRSLASSARGRRRMQLVGVLLVLVSIGVVAWHYASVALDRRRTIAHTADVSARVHTRLEDLRSAARSFVFIDDERACKPDDLRGRRGRTKTEFVESGFLLGGDRLGDGWPIVSGNVQNVLFFESSPEWGSTASSEQSLEQIEDAALFVFFVATVRAAGVGDEKARWEGHVVIAHRASGEALCWEKMGVEAARDSIELEVRTIGGKAVARMSDGLVQVTF